MKISVRSVNRKSGMVHEDSDVDKVVFSTPVLMRS